MTYARLKSNGSHISVGVSLGGLERIYPHTGLDHVSYVDLRFEHGVLQTTRDVLRDIVQQGQETLTAPPALPNCSGSVWEGETE